MVPKKKVLIIGKLPPPFMGPSVAFSILINSALKEHYHLLSLDIKANATLSTLGKWSFKKLFTNISIYFKFFRILRREKPDLVLVPISQATLGFIKDSVFILLTAVSGQKCLVQLRGSNFKTWVSKASFPVKGYVKCILGLTKGVIVLGNNLRYLFSDYFLPGQIFVIPNGGNFPVPDHPHKDIPVTRLIYLGNLQSSKGIEDVMEAIRIINDTLPGRFTLTVIGAWRNESTKLKCIELVRDNNLPVTFLTPDVSMKKFEYLVSSDIFVFPPREPEGHPWVIVEAMAAGLPVISTNQGAITESVINGENGFIVPSNDPASIAGKMEILIKDPQLRQKMGVRSRELYLEKFTEERMVANYCQVFDSVIVGS